MEQKLRDLALTYFDASAIASVTFAGGRAVVTLQNTPENPEKAALLKQALEAMPEVKKANVIFTADVAGQKCQKN